MTNQQILEKAIQKAIDGGWQPIRSVSNDHISWLVWTPWLSVTFDHDTDSDVRHEQRWSKEELIFNHDFAKALWGDMPVGIKPIKAKDYSHHDPLISDNYYLQLWEHHLQQMVIADDPIKYLGDNI